MNLPYDKFTPRGSSHSVVVNMLDFNTIEKRNRNPDKYPLVKNKLPYLTSYELNSAITALLHGWLWH